ncbi:hypothetical protein ACFUJR_36855 [Streptomyces sp. NPDC057271]|uniref:hypothetical protein n=1 Tax=unclassified Streptomyces TaxID=2593676 RepID=UPI003637B0C4
MRVFPLLFGIGWLLFGLAIVKNHRGFADRMTASPVNLMPGDPKFTFVLRVVGIASVVLGGLATLFGLVFLVFS